jgi:hypothetical protein
MNNTQQTLSDPTLAADRSPLGTTANNSTPPGDNAKRWAARAERFLALSQAREWIYHRANKVQPGIQYPGDYMRTHDCRYTRKQHLVGISTSNTGNAHYTGLATCGSVWACPVCAVKIQERRRIELEQLVAWAYAEDQQYAVAMVTFTFPHQAFNSLSSLIERQRDAFKRFRAGSPFKRLRESIGFAGMVRSLEVTHGSNGWHPHTHEIWLAKDFTPDFHSDLIDLWSSACIKAGLLDPTNLIQVHAFKQHSVHVRFDVTAADYLAKQDSSRAWGITHEVAKASSKTGRLSGVHPHEFLVRAGPGDYARYFEYVEGMKGSRQLQWSPGLKTKANIIDVKDAKAADLKKIDDVEVGDLLPEEFDFIRRRKLLAQVLDIVEASGFQQVSVYLAHKGYVRPVFDFEAPPEDCALLAPFVMYTANIAALGYRR